MKFRYLRTNDWKYMKHFGFCFSNNHPWRNVKLCWKQNASYNIVLLFLSNYLNSQNLNHDFVNSDYLWSHKPNSPNHLLCLLYSVPRLRTCCMFQLHFSKTNILLHFGWQIFYFLNLLQSRNSLRQYFHLFEETLDIHELLAPLHPSSIPMVHNLNGKYYMKMIFMFFYIRINSDELYINNIQ